MFEMIMLRPGQAAVAVGSAVCLATAGAVLGRLRQRTSSASAVTPPDWKRIGSGMVSLVLFLISAAWSGYGIFLLYKTSNPFFAKVLGWGMAGIGGMLAVTLQIFAASQTDNCNTRHYSLAMFLFALIWLAASPVFNAVSIAGKPALQAEIIARHGVLTRATEPVLEKSHLLRETIVPEIMRVMEWLKHEAEVQEKEFGGCGDLCRAYNRTYTLMEPTVSRLLEQWDHDDPDKDIGKRIEEYKGQLLKIASDITLSVDDILFDYSSTMPSLFNEVRQANLAETPLDSINLIIQNLNGLKSVFDEYRLEKPNNPLRQSAVERADNTLLPMLINLQQVKRHLEIIGNARKVNLSELDASFASLEITPTLIFKHIKHYWSSIACCYLIDIMALALAFVPMLVFLSEGRKKRRIKDEIHQVKSHAAALERDKVEERKALEKSINRERKIEERELEERSRILAEGQERLSQIKAEKSNIEQSMEQEIAKLKLARDEELGKAVSPEEAQDIKAEFSSFIKNVRKKDQYEMENKDRQGLQVKSQTEKELASLKGRYELERLKCQRDKEKRANKLNEIDMKLSEAANKLEIFEAKLSEKD